MSSLGGGRQSFKKSISFADGKRATPVEQSLCILQEKQATTRSVGLLRWIRDDQVDMWWVHAGMFHRELNVQISLDVGQKFNPFAMTAVAVESEEDGIVGVEIDCHDQEPMISLPDGPQDKVLLKEVNMSRVARDLRVHLQCQGWGGRLVQLVS